MPNEKKPLDERGKMVAAIDERIALLDTNPDQYVKERIAKLDKAIVMVPERKRTLRGTVTMHQHLVSLRKRVKDKPEEFVRKEREKLSENKKTIQESIEKEKAKESMEEKRKDKK